MNEIVNCMEYYSFKKLLITMSQENPLLLWNPKFHSRVDKSPTLVPDLNIQFLQDEFQY